MAKKTFRVYAKVITYSYIDVKADNATEAEDIANDTEAGDFISDEQGGDFIVAPDNMEIKEIKPEKKKKK